MSHIGASRRPVNATKNVEVCEVHNCPSISAVIHVIVVFESKLQPRCDLALSDVFCFAFLLPPWHVSCFNLLVIPSPHPIEIFLQVQMQSLA